MSGPKIAQANYGIDAVTPTNQEAYFVFADSAQGGATITGPLVVSGAAASITVEDTDGNEVVILNPYQAGIGNGSVGMQSGGTGAYSGSGLLIHGIDSGAVVLDYIATQPTPTPPITYRVAQTDPANGNLILGATTSLVKINGATGIGNAYDSVNNRPQPGANFTLCSFSANLTPTPVPYTVAASGWYIFNSYINMQATGFSWPAGYVVTFRLYANGTEVQYSQASWWDMPAPPPQGIEDNTNTIIQLTAGDVLTVQTSSTGLPALGTNGTVICTIKPLLA